MSTPGCSDAIRTAGWAKSETALYFKKVIVFINDLSVVVFLKVDLRRRWKWQQKEVGNSYAGIHVKEIVLINKSYAL